MHVAHDNFPDISIDWQINLFLIIFQIIFVKSFKFCTFWRSYHFMSVTNIKLIYQVHNSLHSVLFHK